MKWTSEQLKAINLTDLNITVSASAGAGKTAVLVQRLMKRIINDRVSVDQIVALTFTEAAAAEMKNRLLQALSKAYLDNPDDEYLKTQITLLPSAKISTIHSFCLSILKDYYYVLQIDPQSLNNILDEPTIAKVKNDAFDYVIANYDSEVIQDTLYTLTSSAMNFDSLKDMVLSLSETSFSKPNPNGWLDDSIIIYDTYSSLDKLPESFLEIFWAYNQNIYNQIKKLAYQLDRLIDSLKEQANTELQKTWISEVISYLKILETAISNQNYHDYKATIENIAKLKNRTISKQEDYQAVREQYFKVLNDAVVMLYDEKTLLDDLAHNKELAKNIVDITKMYNFQYESYIKAENGITFDDMEILTYRLLTLNNNEIAKTLQSEIKDILIDEFQDTNILQNEIIELVGRKDNIFRVGDVKQSIYRFRGAKPSLMQGLIEMGNTDNHQTIFLSNNFRSKNDIVNFNNHIFSHIMNLDTFNSSYSKQDFVTTGTIDQNKDSLAVQLHLINTQQEAYEDFDEDYNLNNNQFKAEYIANQIVTLYNEDQDKKWNKYTVLVEAHKSKDFLRDAFDRANIPYFIAMPDGFYDSFGVSIVHAYLKLILDPNDKIALTAILVNLYGFTDNQIATHFLTYKDMFKVADSLDKSILRQIHTFHNNQNTLHLTDIINHIFEINNFYETKISNQSRTNLDLFYESALNYQKDKSGIYGFLLEIELMKQEKTSEASSISSEDNVVNVMTVHGSKGLQFDTVFMWSKSSNKSINSQSNYVINGDLGLALKTTYLPKRIIKDNLANFLIRFLEKKEDLEEEMRKLYVALTRAQNRMYIIDTFKQDKEKQYLDFDYSHIYNGIGYTGWINAIHQNHPTKTLIVNMEKSFEYQILPKKQQIIASVNKLAPSESLVKPIGYIWPIRPLDLSKEEKGFEVGSTIHNAIEKLPNTQWTREMIKKVSPNINDYYIDKLITLNSNPFFIKLNQETVHKEFPFISYLEEQYQRGIIDYLVETKDNVYIVDFKTDTVENDSELIERYQDQLNFYKQAIKPQFKDRTIELYLYSTHLDKFILIK
ncbi:MAG: UvrD-helicase domain-containing protein [Erysipelothrix sp.]|nr:UvrD-helicase domain-containing protein [Erysipelothrix sp.]